MTKNINIDELHSLSKLPEYSKIKNIVLSYFLEVKDEILDLSELIKKIEIENGTILSNKHQNFVISYFSFLQEHYKTKK